MTLQAILLDLRKGSPRHSSAEVIIPEKPFHGCAEGFRVARGAQKSIVTVSHQVSVSPDASRNDRAAPRLCLADHGIHHFVPQGGNHDQAAGAIRFSHLLGREPAQIADPPVIPGLASDRGEIVAVADDAERGLGIP